MNVQALSGMLHAQELLLVSLIRALPLETRQALADEFDRQIQLAETSHLDAPRDREAHEAFLTHVRKLLIRLESMA
ncbi:hypothetical protein [Burkholderia oklahomensis]|uniref:Uncharacterized protein n=1 Tax=Burkholderia oklahomensis TaxID=342113 RepID=A0AAI8BE43_9BURK|nr:hypothetical protein [Burkholderia oklahomensis]AIO70592.1 hypothetical protein DM82_4250 [Burkholderia oklahomensis]AJX33851.1 hypothetical protein BG90_3773 [Burkholderia oklahomensis C6786]AOI40200.1 hypothetical protein WG70_11620 [Burkholderia oklahomensis EO147]AOI49820.1 hypothetical protein WI23_29365 [Burkholderia oklahomensis C6786]KUY47306.1 hypothetical protein WI23_30390 [Burkholderia oklahomensis C6786]